MRQIPRSNRLHPDLTLVKDGWRCDVFAFSTRNGQWAGYSNVISLGTGVRVERLVLDGEHRTHGAFLAAAQKAALERVTKLHQGNAPVTSIMGSG